VPFTAAIEPSVALPFAYVGDDTPVAEKTYNALFHLRLDSLNIDSATTSGTSRAISPTEICSFG
jgi:hypothetical protein